jgi:hypothetical protein
MTYYIINPSKTGDNTPIVSGSNYHTTSGINLSRSMSVEDTTSNYTTYVAGLRSDQNEEQGEFIVSEDLIKRVTQFNHATLPKPHQ